MAPGHVEADRRMSRARRGVAAAAVRAELRPAGVADLGPRAGPLPPRHDRRPVLEAAPRRLHDAHGAAGRARSRAAAGALDGGGAGRLAARAGVRLPAGQPAGGRRGRGGARRYGRRARAVPDARLVPVRRARQRGAPGRRADAVGDRAPPRRARGALGRARDARLPDAAGAVPVPGPVRAVGLALRAAAAPAARRGVRAAAARVDRPGLDRVGPPARRRHAGAQPARLEPFARRSPLAARSRTRAQPRRPPGGAARGGRRGRRAGAQATGGARTGAAPL